MMAAVWMRARAELRRRRAATVVLALIIGIAGGVAIAAAAGARRTASAFERLVERSRVDVLVNPNEGTRSALTIDAVRELSMVGAAAEIQGVGAIPLTADGAPDTAGGGAFIALAAADDVALQSVSRPNVLEGRLPRAADEALINHIVADRYGLGPGETFRMAVFTGLAEYEGDALPPHTIERFSVSGVGVLWNEVVADEGFRFGAVTLPKAYWDLHQETGAGYFGILVELKRGAADMSAFRRAAAALVPGEALEFQTVAQTADTVQRAVNPYLVSLGMIAAIVGITGLLVGAQTIAREVFGEADDHDWLRALGMTDGQLLALSSARGAAIGLLGAAIAIGIAVGGSVFMPLGPARLAEPTPGIAIDGVAFGAGAAAIVLLTIVAALGTSVLQNRRRRTRGRMPARVSPIAARAARAGASPAMVTGLRLGLEPGRGRTAVPVRTTAGAVAIALAGIVGGITFTSAFHTFLDTPRLYGWNWDLALETDLDPGDIDAILGDELSVAGWSHSSISRVDLEGRTVVAIGIQPVRGRILPTIAVGGRAPNGDDEIALASRTLSALGRSVGQRVTVRYAGREGEPPVERSMTIVGRAVLPGFGTYQGADKTSPGEGAVLTATALSSLADDFGTGPTLVRFRAGSDVVAASSRLHADLCAVAGDMCEEFVDAERLLRPAEVVSYASVRSQPFVLVAVTGALAAGVLAHALTSSVRRRRRDLAILKTLGFERRQVGAAVAWQASTVTVAALCVAIPVGVASGRWMWRVIAERIGTIAGPRFPALALLAVAAATVIAANLVAALPARAAARTRPADVLRAE